MKKHGFRSIFSLLLAVMMVCSMLPTAAFAEGDVEEQSVVVEPGGTPAEEPKQDEVKPPEGETPEEPKQPEGETPEEPKQPEDETPEEPKQPEGETSQGPAKPARAPSKAKSTSVPLTLRISSYGAPFKNGSTGKHNVNTYTWLQYISQSDVGSDNASGSAHAYFKGSNESGWQLWLKVEVGNYKYEAAQNAWVYNKDMSAATGDITYGLSFNSSGGTSTYISIGGAKDLPKPTTYTYVLNYDATGGTGAPSADSWSTTGAYHSFTVASTVPTRAGYTFKGWKGKANDGSDEIYTGGMACAVSQYGNDVVQNDNTWTRTLYAVWEENRPSAAWNEISKALGTQVYVQCVSDTENHAKQGYELRYESSAVGRVTGGYACNVYVYANGKPGLTSYVEEYNTTTYPNTNHVLDSDSDTGKRGFELRYDDGGNGWYIYKGDSVPIVFNVKCEAEEPSKPYKPGDDEVKNLLGDNAVQITCTNTQIGHDSKTFGLIDDTFIVYQSNNRCEVVINNFNPYVSAFDAAVSVPTRTHITDNSMAGQNKTKINLVWSDGRWTPADAPAKYHVLCTLQPAPSSPPTFDELVGILGAEAVKVVCTNAAAGHGEATYALKEETISNPRFSGGPNGHTYTFDINSAEYVTAYNETTGKTHTPGDAVASVTLVWQNGGWKVQSGTPVVFNVACDAQPEETYTVTYKDGADGTVFADDVHSGLKSGEATPPYKGGTPTRDGFTFQGWEPEVTQNVTGNATYTAKWKKDPAPPTESAVMDALRGAVKITCTTPNSGHEAKIYDLMSRFTPGTVQGDASTGYTYTISVDAGSYVWRYNDEREGTGVVHTLDDISPKPITLKWDDGAWVAETNLPINFDVKCEAENPPVDIRKPTFDELKALLSVKVECTNGSATHETKSNLYELKNNDEDSKFEIGEVNQSGDAPTCTVTIGSMPYVAEFDGTTGKAHNPADTTKTVDLVYNKETGKWALKSANDATVVFRVACTTEEPSKPYKPKAEDLLSVVIHCKSDVHNDGLYDLTDGIFTVGEVEGNEADGYTCKVTVEAAQYVNKYVGEMKVNHDIVGEGTKTVTLRYESALERWTVDSTVVTFDVECIPAPNISMLQVQVHCVTPNSSHMDESYDLPEDTTLEYVNANTRKITVQAAPYVEQYGNGHELADGERESKTITATWDGVKWNFDATSVTFYVKCETQPEVPGDITDEDLAKLKVVIHCTTNGSHTDRTYDLIAGTYRRDDSNDGGFTCYIAVLAAPYVNEYISDTGTNHELVDPQKSSKTITLRWNTETKAWAADSNSVTFDVKCGNVPAQKYTVTYTDGVDGVEIFKDQVYADLTAGTATPAFNGTPTRVGYFFAGWNPAVVATVTGNVTYTASWKVDSNNNGKPDDEEERCTVTYLDGANGKAFASQVYPGLLSGTATPKFNGTPARSGYVFIGWSPVWSGTVTGNVTYTATWSTITGGLDKVPKTGDNGLTLALSALLLFSFCGAAACVVSTKKRG